MVIDGEEKKETLFGMVKSTLPAVSNSVIAFHDNSSVSRSQMPTIPPLYSSHFTIILWTTL